MVVAEVGLPCGFKGDTSKTNARGLDHKETTSDAMVLYFKNVSFLIPTLNIFSLLWTGIYKIESNSKFMLHCMNISSMQCVLRRSLILYFTALSHENEYIQSTKNDERIKTTNFAKFPKQVISFSSKNIKLILVYLF